MLRTMPGLSPDEASAERALAEFLERSDLERIEAPPGQKQKTVIDGLVVALTFVRTESVSYAWGGSGSCYGHRWLVRVSVDGREQELWIGPSPAQMIVRAGPLSIARAGGEAGAPEFALATA